MEKSAVSGDVIVDMSHSCQSVTQALARVSRQKTMFVTEGISLALLLVLVSHIHPTEQLFIQAEPSRNDFLIAPDPCDRYDVDGCSVPFKNAFQIVRRFTPACNRHDICYDCGKVRNVTRLECDSAFLEDMMKICHGEPVTLGRWKRTATDMDAPDSDFHDSSVQVFMSKQTIFNIAAEKILGETVDTFLSHASKVELRRAMEDIAPLWGELLRAFRDEGASDQEALDLVDKYSHDSQVVKRDADDVIDVPSCMLAARFGFGLVRNLAMFHYQVPSMHFCDEDFVDDCMPKIL
ncbi:hypothetical protein RRG08_048505 [Elysia crispata]|uniref:Uncharacterized protein n=1 Tax=Elysia crispata TaxID=231223 RepID=A0AAE0YFZ2_9GAST|nr:hypothetical protein RRG08_048505 [Elysia crispata]